MRLSEASLLAAFGLFGVHVAGGNGASAGTPEASDAQCIPQEFQIFDVSVYRDKPEVLREMTEEASVVYAGELFPGLSGAERNADTIASEAVVREIAADLPEYELVVIDIEFYPVQMRHSDKEVAAAVDKLLTILEWMRSERPELKMSFYGVVPSRSWPAAYPAHGPGSEYYAKWAAHNDRLQALADASDFLAPSLYTLYSKDLQDRPAYVFWENYIRRNIAEARRLAKGKPVYPFMWPQYHPSNSEGLAGQYLSGKDWRFQLDLVNEIADGIMLWGGPTPFAAEQWWEATRSFINDRSCSGSARPDAPKLISADQMIQ